MVTTDPSKGPNGVRESVASALNVRSAEVKIDHWRFSPGQRSTRSWGTSMGRRFFAKTLAQDPYPLVPRVAVPGRAAFAHGKAFRSAGEQIEAEWVMTQQLRELVGRADIPALLGRSIPAKTLVWEQATGARVDDAVKRSRWLDPKGKATGAALFQAGIWLRKLHDASSHDEEVVNCGEIIRNVSELLESEGLGSSAYATTALQLLGKGRQHAGAHLVMPIALTHGDFTLANLLWDNETNHLWVVDFEDFAERTLLHDLVTIVFDLRVMLLNPFVPKDVVLCLEKAFWNGYGDIPNESFMWVNVLAAARIFYYYLPRLSSRGLRRGRLAGGLASIYKTFFETAMISRCLSEGFPALTSGLLAERSIV